MNDVLIFWPVQSYAIKENGKNLQSKPKGDTPKGGFTVIVVRPLTASPTWKMKGFLYCTNVLLYSGVERTNIETSIFTMVGCACDAINCTKKFCEVPKSQFLSISY